MQIIRASRQVAFESIKSNLDNLLTKGSVLLLLSGGSNLKGEAELINSMDNIGALTITLMDERFGTPGHHYSNWRGLCDAGLILDKLNTIEVLDGEEFEITVKKFNRKLEAAFKESDYIVGIFGMGADGHTSGILPASPALDAKELVTGYNGIDFPRITTTPIAFTKVDFAYLLAYGDNKQDQVNRLAHEQVNIANQPAQALKKCKSLTIYSDEIKHA